jgi:hypothetical protein
MGILIANIVHAGRRLALKVIALFDSTRFTFDSTAYTFDQDNT